MDYIDFQLVDDEIVCISSYGGKKIKLSSDNTRRFFKILSENNYKYKELVIHGTKTVRYYDVSQKIIDSVQRNKRNINNKKVQRVNKYAGAKVAISGALSLVLILNSLGLYNNKLNEKKENLSDKTSIGISDSIDKLKVPMKFTMPVNENTSLEEVVEPDYVFDFEFEDRSDTETANITRSLYTDVITKYSNMYGLPPSMMIAVATQERVTHSTEISPGGGFGLFQVQVEGGWNWLGKSLSAYNFETGEIETIVVCQREDGTIDMNMLADLDYNVKVGCMIMAYDLNYCNYDLIAALQTYNSGAGVSSLKKEYGEDWLNHRDGLPGGSQYVEYVLSYIKEEDSLLKYKDPNGEEYIVDINNVYEATVNKTR